MQQKTWMRVRTWGGYLLQDLGGNLIPAKLLPVWCSVFNDHLQELGIQSWTTTAKPACLNVICKQKERRWHCLVDSVASVYTRPLAIGQDELLQFLGDNLIPDFLCSQVTCSVYMSSGTIPWKKRHFLYFPSLRKWEILTLLVHLCCIIELSTVPGLPAKKTQQMVLKLDDSLKHLFVHFPKANRCTWIQTWMILRKMRVSKIVAQCVKPTLPISFKLCSEQQHCQVSLWPKS